MVTASSKPTHRKPMSKGPPKQQADPSAQPDERQQREERILDAAGTLLVRWGFRKTTIDDVAREAGVGKGTIYLHWKDKNELFRAAIMRASQRITNDVAQRLADDPEGGQFHRLWSHGMIATLSDPLMAALMLGKSDIFYGLMDTLDQQTRDQLVSNADEYVAQLQQAGVIRADLPVSVITFLMSALKLGIIQVSEAVYQENIPSNEQLTDAISDLMRRWLQPEHLSGNGNEGKKIMTEWIEQSSKIGKQQQ